MTRNQRALFAAQVVESFGAFGLLAAFTLWATTSGASATRVAQLVSWVIAANALPRLLLAPLVARACARFWESHILLAANLGRAAVCLATVALPDGQADTRVVLCAAVLLGCLDQFFGPARAAASQRNLRESERVGYGALNFLALSGIGLVSSAVTPLVFSHGGLRAWLLIGALCSALSMAVLIGGYRVERDLTKRLARPAGESSGTRMAIRLAFTGEPRVRLVTWSILAYGLALGLTNQTMTPLALDALRIPMRRYGWIPGAFAVGGLLAYGITRALAGRRGTTWSLVFGALLLALGYVGYGVSPGLEVWVAAMLLAGVGFGVWSSVQGAILQEVVPNALMGPYVAVTGMLALLVNLAGSQLGRFLVELSGHHSGWGYRASYLVAAVAVVLCALLRGRATREKMGPAGPRLIPRRLPKVSEEAGRVPRP